MKKRLMFILLVLVLAVSAFAFPGTLESVKFDGTTLTSDSINKLNVERGEEYEIKVAFTPGVDLDDVEVEAFISGYEYSDDERISDRSGVFDADANTTYVKKLKIRIPDDADEDSYKLRIIVSDRHNSPLVANFNLKIGLQRHDVKIKDVILNPNGIVEAGSAVIATVRVDNDGEKDEKDVRVEVSIPKLGVSDVEYIDEIESDDEENTEEIFLRIPRCAAPGVYDLNVEVAYSGRHKTVSAKKSVQVVAGEDCGDSSSEEQASVVLVGLQSQTGKPGETLVYPITFSNNGKNSKMFSVSAESVEWADVSVTPSNAVVVPGKDSKVVYLNLKLNDDVEAGSRVFYANIASDDKSENVAFTANVVAESSSPAGWLEFIVIVLVVAIIVLGLIVFFRSRDEKEYY
ncbi:hypothetical protein DRJ25_01120 [Candidatus Woesearchaeota archaeon]|nr:MAG: hypothetical protein DRJ25_01120 [Candidatus Woesearchaeota archaeon]